MLIFSSEEEDWPENCISLTGATEKKVYTLLSPIITSHFIFSLSVIGFLIYACCTRLHIGLMYSNCSHILIGGFTNSITA